MQSFPFQPEQASTIAKSVDHLYYFLTAIAIFFSSLIFFLIFYFMIKYRRRSPDERPQPTKNNIPLEILWTVVPILICAVLFTWGSTLYFENAEPPQGALEIFVTGKQWMWKVEHPEGQREIDELHVPLGRPVKLTLTSEDVIHDFYVPAFRVKKDALPGRYTSLWFEATRVGTFHLFCAQYCGAFHAGMIGSIIVLPPDEYERWLAGGTPAESMEQAGAKVFQGSGCPTCHVADGTGLGPSLLGVYGHPVKLTTGETIDADDAYVRAHILTPRLRTVFGYKSIMPSFQGQLSEEQLNDLIAYVRSLGSAQAPTKQGPKEEGKP